MIYHARLPTAASAYLRLLIFNACQLDTSRRSMVVKLASYIFSVFFYPFETPVAEGPGIMLFQRILLFAHQIDPEIAEVDLKYFNEHALQWLTLIDVALRVFATVISIHIWRY